MLLPAQVTMIPVFIIWQKLGMIDTFAPLTIPAYLGGGAFTIFLLRQFYLTIPRELDEAAMIDGCSYFGIWRHIILPLSRPALITVLLFSFMANWDDFMGPLIYLHSQDKLTVSIGLRLFQDQYGQTNLPLLMAASLLHIAPVVIIFLIGQRYFIKGIVMTGLKG
jgi:multiple sugar transport system permease protein